MTRVRADHAEPAAASDDLGRAELRLSAGTNYVYRYHLAPQPSVVADPIGTPAGQTVPMGTSPIGAGLWISLPTSPLIRQERTT